MFINYSHPSELKDRDKRSQASRYVYHAVKPHRIESSRRNRSAPDARPDSNDGTPAPLVPFSILPPSLPAEDDVQEVVETTAPPLELWTSAGLRGDPFDAYPIRAPLVPAAVDYYKTSYVPIHDFMFKGHPAPNPMIRKTFPSALQSPLQFEGIVLLMTAHSKTAFGSPHLRERALVMHRISVIQQLNSRIADPLIRSDNVTLNMTVALLASFYSEHDEHVKIHLNGLKSLLALRGGLDTFPTYMKLGLMSAQAICLHALKRRGQLSTYSSHRSSISSSTLTYPAHPFSTQLCKLISDLPGGLQEVALTARLSDQLVVLLLEYTKDMKERSTPDRVSRPLIDEVTTSLVQLIIHPTATPLEMSLCGTLLVFRTMVSNAVIPSLLRARVQDVIGSVFELDDDAQSLQGGPRKAIRNCLLWMCMVAADNPPPTLSDGQSGASRQEQQLLWMSKMAQRQPEISEHWDKLEAVLKDFYWRDDVGEQWRDLWQRGRGVPS